MKELVTSVEFSRGAGGKPVHYHDCHQIIYVSSGEAHVTVSGRGYTAGAGTLLLISRFEQHAIEPESGCERYVLSIAPERCVGISEDETWLLSALVNRPDSFRHAVTLDCPEEAQRLLARITAEKNTREPAKLAGYLTGLLLMELFVAVHRSAPEIFALTRRENVETVRRLQGRFERDFALSYTVEGLAQEEHMSASHLSHIFKRVAGVSVMEYLKACRLAAAKGFLAQTRLPVGEIVERCGFSDSSNFSRTFRAHTGLSPSDFRKKYRE